MAKSVIARENTVQVIPLPAVGLIEAVVALSHLGGTIDISCSYDVPMSYCISVMIMIPLVPPHLVLSIQRERHTYKLI